MSALAGACNKFRVMLVGEHSSSTTALITRWNVLQHCILHHTHTFKPWGDPPGPVSLLPAKCSGLLRNAKTTNGSKAADSMKNAALQPSAADTTPP